MSEIIKAKNSISVFRNVGGGITIEESDQEASVGTVAFEVKDANAIIAAIRECAKPNKPRKFTAYWDGEKVGR